MSRKKTPAETTAEVLEITTESPMEIVPTPAPQTPMIGDIFYTTIEEEHEVIRTLARVNSHSAQMLVLHLIHVRDRAMWEKHRDNDGQPHKDWTAYLNWVCAEYGIHRATLYRGMRGNDRLLALGVPPSAMLNLTPATVDNVSGMLTVTDPDTKTVSWSDEVVARATAQGINPIDVAVEIVQLPRKDVLKAAREVSKQPPSFYLQGNLGEDKVELVVLRGDDRVLRLVAFDLEEGPELSDALDYLARKLNLTFIGRE